MDEIIDMEETLAFELTVFLEGKHAGDLKSVRWHPAGLSALMIKALQEVEQEEPVLSELAIRQLTQMNSCITRILSKATTKKKEMDVDGSNMEA